MIKSLFVVSALILSCLLLPAQNLDDTLRQIDQKVSRINGYAKNAGQTLKDEAFLDSLFLHQEGKGYGTLSAFKMDGRIVKIRELIGVERLQDVAITEYFFEEGQLIFVSEEESYGPSVMVDSSGTVDHKISEPDFQARYYFNKGRMLFSEKSGQQQILPNEMYFLSQSKEGQLMETVRKYLELFSGTKQ